MENAWTRKDVPYEFGETTTYTCKNGTFFEADRNKPSIEITCMNDGKFDLSDHDNCVASEYLLFPNLKFLLKFLSYLKDFELMFFNATTL